MLVFVFFITLCGCQRTLKGTDALIEKAREEMPITDAENNYTKALETASKLLENGYITEEEYKNRQLSAIESVINAYIAEGKISDSTLALYINRKKTLTDLIEANKMEAEASEKAAEIAKRKAEDMANYKTSLSEIVNRKSGIDPFSSKSEIK